MNRDYDDDPGNDYSRDNDEYNTIRMIHLMKNLNSRKNPIATCSTGKTIPRPLNQLGGERMKTTVTTGRMRGERF